MRGVGPGPLRAMAAVALALLLGLRDMRMLSKDPRVLGEVEEDERIW